MTQDDRRVISLDEARRARRARELREAAERARGEGGQEQPVRISDAMTQLLEDDEHAGPGEGPSAEHLRDIVEREFADGEDGSETSEVEGAPGTPAGSDGAQQ